MNQRQAKRADEKRYKAAKAYVNERSDGLCECPHDRGCTVRAQVTHHRLPRKATSTRIVWRHDPGLLVDLCDHCHVAWHDDPERAYRCRVLLRRPPPGQVPEGIRLVLFAE